MMGAGITRIERGRLRKRGERGGGPTRFEEPCAALAVPFGRRPLPRRRIFAARRGR
jgi:hypothetical protein